MQDNQYLNNDTFYRPAVTSAQCIIGTKKFLDSAFLINFDNDDFSQRYGQIKEAFKALTKDYILNPYITDLDFTSSNEDSDVGYNIYAFDIPYQENPESAQPIEVEIEFSEKIHARVYGYALALTNKLVSINSDGQKHFEFFNFNFL